MRYAARSLCCSPYIASAKLAPAARFDLSSSGVPPVELAELQAEVDGMQLRSRGPYGDPRLIEMIAERAGVAPECVVLTVGTSLANHLVMAALFDPGDEVLIEQPTYDPLLHTARLLGAKVRRLQRREVDGFSINPDDVSALLKVRTRLIALCNLHNPTSARLSDELLRSIGEVAARAGTCVLVDEVYREAVWGEEKKHALSLGENLVVTSSLTKAFGLGGLRCG